MKRRDMKYVTSALQAAKPMLLKMIQDFDSQDFMLNTPVAAYDLTKGLQERCRISRKIT
jgi:putative DNA primase/helicase